MDWGQPEGGTARGDCKAQMIDDCGPAMAECALA